MISKLKKLLYFPVAQYFRFFANIQLGKWKPRIIVITGSSGKTTLLHLIESQIGEEARYSHNANSSFGIPFDILGLKRTKLTLDEWPYLFLKAPFRAFKKSYKEKLYVVEADCDRPNEGKFLASLLKPEVTLLTNVGRTHSQNFDYLVANKKFSSVEEAIAHEFGYFLEHTSDLVILNSDNELIRKESHRSKVKIKHVSLTNLASYKVSNDHTELKINTKDYLIKALLPKEASISIQMTLDLLEFLRIKLDFSFSKFSLPPGRCSLMKGVRDTTIIDSSYNATPDGVKSILSMFDKYPSRNKWLVLGDMIELGEEEKEEHEKLADVIATMSLEKIVLVGPRVSKYTYPKLKQMGTLEKFLMPKDALNYLLNKLEGGETILFKGARFLEGIIEHLLANKNDIEKLCRREKIWQERREKWGL